MNSPACSPHSPLDRSWTRRVKSRSSISRTFSTAFSVGVGFVGLIVAPELVRAADGTWINVNTGGLWNDTANWSGGVVAEGVGATANFNTLDITADNTVQLDSPHIVGSLIFGDTAVATAAGWTLSNNGSAANILTLATATGAPTVTVNALGTGKITNFITVLAGTQGLTKAGAGELQLNGVNTYSGTTTVNTGILRLKGSGGAGGTILNSGAIAINGGSLILESDGTNGVSVDRVADAAALNMNGGLFQSVVSTAAGVTFGETVGALNLASGGNRVVNGNATGSGSSSTLTFASLNRTQGSTLNFGTVTNAGNAGNRVVFNSAPAVDGAGLIGGWATIGGADFASYGANGVVAATNVGNSAETTWASGQNIKITTGQTLTANRVISSLVSNTPAAGVVLNLGGFTLRVESGGVLGSQTAAGNSTISGGNLTAGTAVDTSAELFLMGSQSNTRPVTVSANIVDNGTGVVSVVTNGSVNGSGGVIVLSGANTYTGTTTVAGGDTRLGSAITNNKALFVATGATLNLGGLTHTFDGLSGGGTVGILNAAAGGTTGSTLSLGNSGGSATFTGTLTVSGLSGRNLNIVKNGTGTQVIAGTDNRDVTTTGNSTTTVNNGTLQFARQVALYNNNTARYTATNIIVNSGGTLALNVGGTNEFTSANVDTIRALGTGTGGFQSGSSLGLDTTNAAGGNFTYTSNVANPNSGANALGLTKLGTGSLSVSGTLTYTGATTIFAGSLLVNGSTATGSAVGVNGPGAALGGNGIIGGPVTVTNGSITPGATTNSIGQLSLVSALNLNSGSTLNLQIGGQTTAGVDYDFLNLSSSVAFGGALVVSDFGTFDISSQAGTYNLLDFSSHNGAFGNVIVDGALLSYANDLWTGVSGGYNLTFNQGDGVLTVAAVPEPSSVALLSSLGLVGMLRLRQRRR